MPNSQRWMPLLAALFLGLSVLTLWNLRAGPPSVDRTAGPVTVVPRGDLAEDEKATIDLFRAAAPSVVFVTSIAIRQDFWTLDQQEVPEGTGSGFVWDDRGHIVTNFHVIQNADRATVTLSDHSTWEASVAGVAPDKDLAVLQIDAPREKLRPLPIGTSHDLQVGQKTFAIGNPFGLDQTLTTGVVSALGRQIESVTRRPIRGVIQTDAAINPGNSGGPLLDSAGRLIGVNTAIYSPSGASAGIGFAIPVDTVKAIVPKLIAHGRIVRPILGVQLADAKLAQRLGVEGALVIGVVPGSGAEKAGIRPTVRDRRGRIRLGDVITAVDGRQIANENDLFDVLEGYKPGDTVSVTVLRDGQAHTFRVTLQESR